MANYAAGAANTYPLHQPSSPCSDSDDEDFSDLDALQNESLEASRMRYKPLRSNPPRPNTGPPAMRGMRGARGAGPRGGPRSHRGTARSYSSESSRQVVGGGNQLPATHTVSAPFPSPHLSMDGECFSLQRKWLMLSDHVLLLLMSDHVLLLLLSNTTWAIEWHLLTSPYSSMFFFVFLLFQCYCTRECKAVGKEHFKLDITIGILILNIQ